jgi:two-component system cell cycle sensor histidine kinase/response regulator CckA
LPSPRWECPSARVCAKISAGAVMAFLLCLVWLTRPDYSLAQHHVVKVLVVHSYHQGYLWTDEINQGIKEIFRQAGPEYELYIEYLDCKRRCPSEVFPLMAQLLASKYRASPPKVIIATDDTALDFMLKKRDRLFPGVPLIFCGVNDYKPGLIAGLENCTGVAENSNLAGTVGLMLGLHPGTGTVAVVSDNTPSGQVNIKRMRKIMPRFKDRVKFVEMAGLEAGELAKRLGALPPDSVVLNLSFWRDGAGRVFEFEEGITFVTEASPAPVYAPWDHMIRCGAVGGMVITGAMQGKEAARLALMVLSGRPMDQIPVITDSLSLPMFDFNALQKFGISLDSLPPDSVILNRPENFYHRYKLLIWLIAAFILAQSLAILSLGVNVARRRRAEKALRGSEQRYRDLFDSISDLIYTQDLQGCFISVNRAMANIYGYSRKEIVGKRASDFMKPEFRQAFDTVYLEAMKKKGQYSGTSLYIDRKGNRHYVEYHSALVRPSNGPAYISGSGHDVTERIQTERQLRALQRQLMQSQKMEAIGTLAGGIAHDFNNIIGVMLGYTELALDQAEEGRAAPEELKAVLRACERGRDLVRQILAFSRQEEANRTPVDLALILKEALKLLRASLPRTIEIKSALSGRQSLSVADPTQMHQVLMNLCANAAYAMRDKGGVLSVNLSRLDLDGNEAKQYPPLKAGVYNMLTVSDTGQGMSQEVQDRIFEPFYTTKPHGEGTGMGLAVVHGIVSAHGGALRVWSAPGQGARFEIILPAATQAMLPEIEQLEPVKGGQERILVVDDEPDISRIVQRALSNQGYQVDAYNDAKQALRAIREKPYEFDLLFTDQTMPGMTGAELAQEAFKLRPDLPVIVCTGFSESMDRDKAKSLGIKEFVMKPVLGADLARTVRRVLDQVNVQSG